MSAIAAHAGFMAGTQNTAGVSAKQPPIYLRLAPVSRMTVWLYGSAGTCVLPRSGSGRISVWHLRRRRCRTLPPADYGGLNHSRMLIRQRPTLDSTIPELGRRCGFSWFPSARIPQECSSTSWARSQKSRRSREAHRFASCLVFVNSTAKGVGESAKGSQMCDCRMVAYEEWSFTGTKPLASEERNSRSSAS